MIQWAITVTVITIALSLMFGIWRNGREDRRRDLYRTVKRASQLSVDLVPTNRVVWYDNETHAVVRRFDVCTNETHWVDLTESNQSDYLYLCCPACHLSWPPEE